MGGTGREIEYMRGLRNHVQQTACKPHPDIRETPYVMKLGRGNSSFGTSHASVIAPLDLANTPL